MNDAGLSTNARQQLMRQATHWTQAAARLQHLEDLAAPEAWRGLDQYLNTSLRESLLASVTRLLERGRSLLSDVSQLTSPWQAAKLQEDLSTYRTRYFKVETTIDFFTDAINTRTNPDMAAMLKACDYMASQSMRKLLQPIGLNTPPVFTYLTEGKGASILKKDIKLWDRETVSPVAAIKIVRHNLLRPTSLLHEAGHQAAHLLNWNQELARLLLSLLSGHGRDLAETWAGWASEIAADTFAFVHTGYAAVTSLHDILVGDKDAAFRYFPGDPHPVHYLRVLLNIAMCRISYGHGHWDDLEREWIANHPLTHASGDIKPIVEASAPLLDEIAKLCLHQPMRAFKGRSIAHWLPPERASFQALQEMERSIGPALYASNQWLKEEAIRLLAYHGYLLALHPEDAQALMARQRAWMIRLGRIHTHQS